jgi:hypothetical protein
VSYNLLMCGHRGVDEPVRGHRSSKRFSATVSCVGARFMRSFIIMGKAMSSAAERRKIMSKAKKAKRTLFAMVYVVVGIVDRWYILRRRASNRL